MKNQVPNPRRAGKKVTVGGPDRMTAEDVVNIRRSPRTEAQIAADYGIVRPLVAAIKARAAYSNVPDPD